MLAGWFYLRSPLAHLGLFGVHRLELFALVALAALWQRRVAEPEQPGARFAVWLALFATLFLALEPRSDLLYTPSSDPDFHALYARLTAQAGEVLYTLAPRVDAPLHYPSGFSVLCALWMNLAFLSPVQAVNLMPALQTFLLLGLLVEAAVAARGRVEALPLALLVALAHFGFFLFVNAEHVRLDGTPRLSDAALMLLPLTAAAISAPAWAATSVAGLAWVFTQNPAHAAVALPPILAGALVVLLSHKERRVRWRIVAAAGAFAALLVASDAWVRNEMTLRIASARGAPSDPFNEPVPQRSISRALAAGLRAAAENSRLAILPQGCVPGAQCRPHLERLRDWAGPLLALLSLLALWRGPRRSAALGLAAAGAIWSAAFLAGATDAALPEHGDLGTHVLRTYLRSGFIASTAPLFLLELFAGAALIAEWLKHRWAGAAAAVILLAAGVADPEASEAYADLAAGPPPSSLGTIEREDLSFIRKAAPLVDARVLLPGYVSMANRWEPWFFALGGGRAVPLYTDLSFAWFTGSGQFDPPSYLRRVCRVFDLRFLWEHGVRFLLETPDEMGLMCVHALPALKQNYLRPLLREGPRALWALRGDQLDEASRDPLLGVPLSAPPRGKKGAGVIAKVKVRGPYGVSGWACDRGSDSPVGVQLELRSGGDKYVELHPAVLSAGAEAREACGSEAHGFMFAPVVAPAGAYLARLLVWDAAGEEPRAVAEGFFLRVPF